MCVSTGECDCTLAELTQANSSSGAMGIVRIMGLVQKILIRENKPRGTIRFQTATFYRENTFLDYV